MARRPPSAAAPARQRRLGQAQRLDQHGQALPRHLAQIVKAQRRKAFSHRRAPQHHHLGQNQAGIPRKRRAGPSLKRGSVEQDRLLRQPVQRGTLTQRSGARPSRPARPGWHRRVPPSGWCRWLSRRPPHPARSPADRPPSARPRYSGTRSRAPGRGSAAETPWPTPAWCRRSRQVAPPRHDRLTSASPVARCNRVWAASVNQPSSGIAPPLSP